MTRLSWGDDGTRYVEAGIDRGVVDINGVAYAWGGLVSVDENPSGGSPQPYYFDGFKFLNVATSEEYEATISAFSAPREFKVCDGTVALAAGLFATQQPRKPFHFSYRTLIGNDIDGIDHGYKLHIVYNALAEPASRSNVTLSESPAPMKLSWNISTTPKKIAGIKPTAHLVIESTQISETILQSIEDIIYGTEASQPRIPSPEELLALYNAFDLIIEDLGGGEYAADGNAVEYLGSGVFAIDHADVVINGDGSFTVL